MSNKMTNTYIWSIVCFWKRYKELVKIGKSQNATAFPILFWHILINKPNNNHAGLYFPVHGSVKSQHPQCHINIISQAIIMKAGGGHVLKLLPGTLNYCLTNIFPEKSCKTTHMLIRYRKNSDLKPFFTSQWSC